MRSHKRSHKRSHRFGVGSDKLPYDPMDLTMLIEKIQDTKDENAFKLTEKDKKVINYIYEKQVTPLEVAIINTKFYIASILIKGGAEITDQAFKDINIIIKRTEIFIKSNEFLLENCESFREFMQSAKDAKTQQKKT